MTLDQACTAYHWCPVLVMNLLQDYGLVSDLAVWPQDVAPQDCDLAIRFCKLNSVDLLLNETGDQGSRVR